MSDKSYKLSGDRASTVKGLKDDAHKTLESFFRDVFLQKHEPELSIAYKRGKEERYRHKGG